MSEHTPQQYLPDNKDLARSAKHRPSRVRIALGFAGLATIAAVTVGCGESATGNAIATPVTTTLAPAPVTTTTTETPVTTTMSPTTETAPPTAVQPMRQSLCDVGDTKLGIPSIESDAASCAADLSDPQFQGIVDDAFWYDSVGNVHELIVSDPDASKFGLIPSWNGVDKHNALLQIGATEYNTLCTTTTNTSYTERGCFTLLTSNQGPAQDVMVGVETTNNYTEAQRLALLGNLVAFQLIQPQPVQ